MPKDYLKRDITVTRRTTGEEPCDACLDQKEHVDPLMDKVKEIIPDKITYKINETETPEGRKYMEDKNITSLPYTEDCKTFSTKDCTMNNETGKEECKTERTCKVIKGFDADDFNDLEDLVEGTDNEE